MDWLIAAFLIQDGVVTGAVYGLLALAIVLIYRVTSVIFIPQGDFLTFSALTFVALQDGRAPTLAWFILSLVALSSVVDLVVALRRRRIGLEARAILTRHIFPVVGAVLLILAGRLALPMALEAMIVVVAVTSTGPLIYRIFYQPVAHASVLTLFMVSAGVHFILVGLGILFFGAEGARAQPFTRETIDIAGFPLSYQSIAIVICALIAIGLLFALFEATYAGKALQATAENRLGARLQGIRTEIAGRVSFAMAAFLGAVAGILIAPVSVIYYDSGFILGLKGFVGAIFAGLISFPLAAVGAIGVGVLEAFSAFWFSTYKEAIVFGLLIPILLWRSSKTHQKGGGRKLTRPILAAISVLCIAGLTPILPPFWLTLLTYASLDALVVLGLVLLTGVVGTTSFGQAAFVGIGAYATAVLTTSYGMSPWLGLLAALAASTLGALLIGLVTIRLSGHYLPLATLAWGITIFYLMGNLPGLGGPSGIGSIPPLSLFGWTLTDERSFFAFTAVILATCMLGLRNLLDSQPGRAFRALPQGDVLTESLGVATRRQKLMALVISAQLAGLAGWLYAHFQRFINPTPFDLNASIEYLLIAVIGGLTNIWGALLGALVITLLRHFVPELLGLFGGVPLNIDTILFGGLLVLLLQHASGGLSDVFTRFAPRRHQVPILPNAALLPEGPKGKEAGSELISASGMTKRFGGLVAVDDVSLDLKAGEIVALIGPNGAGKSTLFNLLSGVFPPSSGNVVFVGREVSGADIRHIAGLGMSRTFQHTKLVPEMTVLENVALGAHSRLRGNLLGSILRLDRHAEARLFAEAARQSHRVGLGDVLDRPAEELSLGLQRLVEIARALCAAPVLLILDEPAAGLRLAEKAELASCLEALRKEGLTILVIEHDMGFVMGLSDRIVVMNLGRKIAEGTPEEVRADPSVVEAYLGPDFVETA